MPRLPSPEDGVRPMRPVLTLSGIIMGAEPAGIVEGLPSSESARVVRVGDSVGDIVVLRVTPAEVELKGPDTTWLLRVPERRDVGP